MSEVFPFTLPLVQTSFFIHFFRSLLGSNDHPVKTNTKTIQIQLPRESYRATNFIAPNQTKIFVSTQILLKFKYINFIYWCISLGSECNSEWGNTVTTPEAGIEPGSSVLKSGLCLTVPLLLDADHYAKK